MPGDRAPLSRRLWLGPLWAHALLLAVLLVVFAPVARIDEAFTIDEGAYGLQVRSLDRGSWAFDYAGDDVDPRGRWLPLYNAIEGDDDWFPYVKHPTYPVVQLAATRALGDVVGLHLWGLLGALGVAVAAWLVAEELRKGAGRVAFWVAATAPVFVNAFIVWAHAPSAALAGFALLAGLRLTRHPSWPWTAVLAFCVGACVLIRAEGLLFAIALAGGLAVGARRRALGWQLGLPALCATVGGMAAVAESAWRRRIVGRAVTQSGFRGENGSPFSGSGGVSSVREWAEGRLEGAWNSLIRGSLGESRGSLLVACALVLLLYAGWVARRQRPLSQRDATLAVGIAALLYALRLRSVATQPITGLLAAWPLAVLGLAVVPRGDVRKATVPAVVVVLFSLAVLATQYSFGGGREWGGRFFLPMLVPVAVLAALGLRSALASLSTRKVVAPLCVALALLPTIVGVRVLNTSRTQVSAILAEVTADPPKLIMTHVSGLPPFAWKEYPEVGWLAVPPNQFEEAAAALRADGVSELLLLGPNTTEPADVPSYVAEDVTGPEARRRGWRTFQLRER